MTLEEIDRQMRRAYALDRLPGLADRNELGQYGRARVAAQQREVERDRCRRERRCAECGAPILGRPHTASTCLVHRRYPAAPKREELEMLLAEHMGVVEQITAAILATDEERRS